MTGKNTGQKGKTETISEIMEGTNGIFVSLTWRICMFLTSKRFAHYKISGGKKQGGKVIEKTASFTAEIGAFCPNRPPAGGR